MRGYPRFTQDEPVLFFINHEVKMGTIYIIDAYGTFFCDDDVHYDIMVESENTLYKHIPEGDVMRIENIAPIDLES